MGVDELDGVGLYCRWPAIFGTQQSRTTPPTLSRTIAERREGQMITFDELVRQQRKDRFIPQVTISLDPGDTTGIAVWEGTELVHAGQVEGTPSKMIDLCERYGPTAIVMEEYRIYETHAKEHIHSDVPTLRLIGGIEMLAELMQVPVYKYGAGQHKPFSTDEKLKMWGFYQSTYRHANDAIRVGMFHLIFGE